jgi:hypothetical protein
MGSGLALFWCINVISTPIKVRDEWEGSVPVWVDGDAQQ